MTTSLIRDDFEVVTARGAPIAPYRRFDDLVSASRFAKAKASTFPGCSVIRVTITTTEERTTAYRPRPRPADLDIPPVPERKAS